MGEALPYNTGSARGHLFRRRPLCLISWLLTASGATLGKVDRHVSGSSDSRLGTTAKSGPTRQRIYIDSHVLHLYRGRSPRSAGANNDILASIASAPGADEMHFSHSLTLFVSYLLFIVSPLLAIPLTISAQATSPHRFPRARISELRPRYFPLLRDHSTITADSTTHRTTFTTLLSFYPVTPTIVRTLYNLYFEIAFNLSPDGDWFNVPEMSRILLKQNGIYLLFTSSDPALPVPWALVKKWAESMELVLNRGGFCGTYMGTMERLTDGFIEYYIRLGFGDPLALAAAAARKVK